MSEVWEAIVAHYQAVGFWHTVETFAAVILGGLLIVGSIVAVIHDERKGL